jgi:hypothetical protein
VTFTTTPASFANTGGGLIMGREATSTGTLTISGGTMTHALTNTAGTTGANGAIYLGVNNSGVAVTQGGRGFLTMTGGTLAATGLFVEGEQTWMPRPTASATTT